MQQQLFMVGCNGQVKPDKCNGKLRTYENVEIALVISKGDDLVEKENGKGQQIRKMIAACQ